MKIAYNPTTAAALTTAPNNNDITFDLKGLNIFTRGIKFKGTDTTYSVFKKHTSSGSGGYNGLVPVPSYTATNVRFLREDGTWSIPAAEAAAFIYTQLTNQDLDDYLDEGRWYYAGGGNTTTNKPSGVDAYELYVGQNASGYRYQKLITSSGLIWFRYHDSSAWKTWVRWYTDMNTDQKVLQSATTTSNFRPLVLGYTNTNTPADLSASTTQQVYTTTTIYAQPSTGSLWANKLYSGGKPVLTEHQSLANYVTLNTAQTITGVKTFAASFFLDKSASLIQNQEDSSNYTTAIRWYKGGTSQGTYNPSIGQHNTGGDGKGSICILPYPTETYPWGGTVGLFISKGVLKLDGKSVALAENYYTKTESDERYVNVTGDTMTGPLIVKATVTGTQLISTIATGTSPLKVTSTTVVTNLNSDLFDGFHETAFVRSFWTSSPGYDCSKYNSRPLISFTYSNNAPFTGGFIDVVTNGYGFYLGTSYTSNAPLYYKGHGISSDGGMGTWQQLARITDNVASATKLQTARTINGTLFDGTANITTAYWGTARTITLSGAVTGSASVNGSQNVTITTTYQTGSIDGRYVGGNKTANHGSSGTAYTADSYSSTFARKEFVAFAERGSWAYANNGYVTTDTGVNIPLAGTAVFQWGASDTNKTQLFITPHNNSGVSNPAANEMLFYTSNGSGYTSAWTRVLTHRNYTNYTVTKTGGGASGTWGISITGNSNKANYIYYDSISNLNSPSSWTSDGYRLVYDTYSDSASNKPVSYDNANGIITLFKSKYGTSNQYVSQLAFPNNTRMYFRYASSGSFSSWYTIAYTSDIKDPANYYWANVRVSASSNSGTSPTFNTCYTSNWFRSTGSTGWYSESYGGGWYMTDSTWIRTYGSKSVYQNTGQIRTDGYLVTNGGITVGATSPNNGTYKSHVTGNSWSSGYIRAGAGFYHNSVNSNSYVLLAGGSYKPLADFAKGNAGASNRGVYVTNGTVTAMTYYLNATVNSGASGRLAYYSGTNSIDDYTSTVGSSGTPIYLSSGVPTACTGVTVKYWASYTINNYSGTSVTYSKNGGNYNFVTSASRRDTGRYTIGTVYPPGQTWYTTLVWAVGNLNSSNSSNSLLYCTLIRGYNSRSTYYWYVNTADDASTNNGSFELFFLCF